MLNVPFLWKKMFKQICSKGTSNVLQEGGSAEYGQIPYFYIFVGPFPYYFREVSQNTQITGILKYLQFKMFWGLFSNGK